MPSRMDVVSRAIPASVTHESVGPGKPVATHGHVVIGPKERRIPKCLRGSGDGELVGVGGALLGFDERAKIHDASLDGLTAS